MSLFAIFASVFALVVLLPFAASFLMKTILKNIDHEGIYDDLDQDS
jgi:F0F1-type ATP synthase membrane subunit b/b'